MVPGFACAAGPTRDTGAAKLRLGKAGICRHGAPPQRPAHPLSARIDMKIAIPKERRTHETRVAATPDTVKKLIGLGFEIVVETGAGEAAAFPDSQYVEAGASIAPDAAEALGAADIVFKVQRPLTVEEGGPDDVAMLRSIAGRLAARPVTTSIAVEPVFPGSWRTPAEIAPDGRRGPVEPVG